LTSAAFEEVTATWDTGAIEIVQLNAHIDARVFGESCAQIGSMVAES
jgi:hypothetical protein